SRSGSHHLISAARTLEDGTDSGRSKSLMKLMRMNKTNLAFVEEAYNAEASDRTFVRSREDSSRLRESEKARFDREPIPELAQLLFYGQRPEQFCLSLLALGNVDAEAKHVGLAVDFDDLSREQQRAKGALPVASLALNLAH